MDALAIIGKHILLPVVIWMALFAWANAHAAPEATYLMVIAFAAYWCLRALILCLSWPLAGGLYYATGQLVALALFHYWPILGFGHGLSIQVSGAPFRFLPNSDFAASLIKWITITDRYLPMILIAAAGVLVLSHAASLLRRPSQTAAPSPQPAAPSSPKDAIARPMRKSGYAETSDNPLDAFR